MSIEIVNLKKYYPVQANLFSLWGKTNLKALDGIDLKLDQGETIALIGESGCGKTTTGKLVLGLETPTAGKVLMDGKDIHALSPVEIITYRKSIQAVFQNPYASLNPRIKIGEAIAEPIIAQNSLSLAKSMGQVLKVLSQVGLPEEAVKLYPHEFSGGQRQRIAIARALIAKPRFIVLDEPVSALDVSIRAQIINLLKKFQKELKIGYFLISHDLATTIHLSHKISVIYAGKLVESLPASKIFKNSYHPYTKALIEAVDPDAVAVYQDRSFLVGEVSDPLNPPKGCRFHPRCSEQIAKCQIDEPELHLIEEDHFVRCHLAG